MAVRGLIFSKNEGRRGKENIEGSLKRFVPKKERGRYEKGEKEGNMKEIWILGYAAYIISMDLLSF